MIKKINAKTLLIISYILIVVLAGYSFFGNFIFVNASVSEAMPTAMLITISSLAILGTGAFSIVAYKKFKINTSFWVFIILGILLICNLITILITPTKELYPMVDIYGQSVVEVIIISDEQKLRFIFQLLSLLNVILLLVFYITKIISTKIFFYVVTLFIVVTAIFGIYSIAVEHQMYGTFISNLFKGEFSPDCATRCFFATPNNWGLLLLIAVFASLYAYTYKKHFAWLLLLLYFIILLFFTQCKTSYILCAFLLIAYFLYLFFVTYKEHKVRNLIILSSIALVMIVAVILLATVGASFMSKFFANASHTLDLRIKIWGFVFDMNSSGHYLWIGRGQGISSIYINRFDPAVVNAHNIYVSVFGMGGIVYLVAFVASLVWVFILTIKYWKINRNLSYVILLGLISMCLVWLTEA